MHCLTSRPLLLWGTLLALSGCREAALPTRFTALAAEQTGVQFTNRVPDETADGMNIVQYLYYYNGGGVAAGDLNNDGLTDLFFTSNLEQNRLYLNRGNFRFEDATDRADVAGTPGTWNTGVTLTDVNADGWLDIYVCRVGQYKKWQGRNQLFVNQQDGTFRDEAQAYGLDFAAFSTQAAFFDYDGDQDLDCFLLCHSVHSAGGYRDTSLTRRYDPLAADRLLRNEGPGRPFTDVSGKQGIYGGTAGYGLGLAVGDFDGDHWPDVYVANDFHENDYFYHNRAGRGFDEAATRTFGHTSNFSMGCDLADCNNDGAPDLVTLDMKPADEPTLKASQPADGYEVYQYKHALGYHWQFPRNMLQLNPTPNPSPPGEGDRWVEGDNYSFSKKKKEPAVAQTKSVPLPRGGGVRGGVLWPEVAQFAGVAATDWSWSALWADLDLDGWRDLYITNGIARRPNDLDYLKFISSATVQRSATDRQFIEKMPPGAVPNVCFNNLRNGTFGDVAPNWGLAEKGCSNGAVYADLDNDGDLDLVTNNLNAPASIFRNETIGGPQKGPEKAPNYLKIKLKNTAPNTFAIGAKAWAHLPGGALQYAENQPVRGFQSCVEPGVLYFGLGEHAVLDSLTVRWPDGRWTVLRQVSANQTLLLDATQPNVTSAGLGEKMPVAAPPLFRPLNAPREATAVEAPFTDKFQVWQVPDRAPLTVPRDSLAQWLTPAELALVTSVQRADLDGDQRPDLVLSGEWMPLVVLRNTAQGWQRSDIPQSTGLWQTLACADLDGDGDTDLAAGNWGLNSILQASHEQPLERWVKDFDQNGQPDPILAYWRQGRKWIFYDKDWLVGQLPQLRKRFVEYHPYAQSTFDDVFTKDLLAGAVVQRAECLSTCWVENAGNGQWELHPLPSPAQYSAVLAVLPADFDGDGYCDLLLGGNIDQVYPTLGRLDASEGLLLHGDGRGGFAPVPNSGFRVRGSVRRLFWLKPGVVRAELSGGGTADFSIQQ